MYNVITVTVKLTNHDSSYMLWPYPDNCDRTGVLILYPTVIGKVHYSFSRG